MVLLYRDHPSAAYQNTCVAQLANMPLVLPVKGYSIRAFLDKVFQEANLIPDIASEINVTDMLLKLVDTGKWCTVSMKTSLFNYPSLVAIPILGEEMERQATITWPVDVYRKKVRDRICGSFGEGGLGKFQCFIMFLLVNTV